MLHLSREVQ